MRYKNENIYFSEGNLRSNPNGKCRYLIWSITPIKTCPFKCSCEKKCFALKNMTFKHVRDCRETNYQESLKDTFVKDVIETIEFYISKKKCENKKLIVRIHASGDFYSKEYFLKWRDIANHFKDNKRVMFQCYTKSIQYIKDIDLKNTNIHIVYSQWDDSPKEDVALAKKLNLPIFYATSREKVEEHRKQGHYICPKSNDQSCMECYLNNKKLIVVSYH